MNFPNIDEQFKEAQKRDPALTRQAFAERCAHLIADFLDEKRCQSAVETLFQ